MCQFVLVQYNQKLFFWKWVLIRKVQTLEEQVGNVSTFWLYFKNQIAIL